MRLLPCLLVAPSLLFAMDFNTPRAYPLGKGFSGYSVVTGDFNNDGVPDVAVSVYSYTVPCCVVEVFLGQADGGLRHLANYTLNQNILTSYQNLVAADFNHDGNLELAVPGAVLLGKGDGTFAPPIAYPANASPQSIVAGDFNGDGVLDIAGANGSGNENISILLGNGDGTFQPPLFFDVGTSPLYLASADFNRDGKADLAVTNYGSGTISILFGRGDGTFGTTVNYTVGGEPESIAVGDFNHDGRPDLAITQRDGPLSIMLAAGGGNFLPPVVVDAGNEPIGVTVIDLNGDGNLDLAVANSFDYNNTTGGYTVSIVKGNGDGTFQPPETYDVPSYPTSLAWADFNGDGKLDLAVNSSSGLAILMNNSHGGLKDMVNQPAGTTPSAIAAADLNGDGKLDLAVANKGSNNVSIFLGNGDGTFQPQVTYGTVAEPATLVIGDFNGDGIPDLALASSTTLGILFGNGDGSFQPPVTTALSAYGSLVAADFNGDGMLDLEAINACQCSAVTLLGNGDGTFRQIPLADNDPGVIQYLATGDFNGDGKPDLVVQTAFFGYDYSAEFVTIWLGNGQGDFQIVSNFDAIGPVAVADFNGDGKPDLAATYYIGNRDLLVALGTGDGSFSNLGAYAAQIPIATATGDFNGDGKPDVAVIGDTGPVGSSDVISILLNRGDGTLETQKQFVVGGCAVAMAVGDFNGDGKADIATANSCSNDVSILKNTTQ